MNFAHNCRLEVQLATACLNYTIIKPRGRHSRAGLCERCQTNDVHDTGLITAPPVRPRDCSLKKIPDLPPNKIRKILKKSKNSKEFFEDLKSVHLIWEWKTPRI